MVEGRRRKAGREDNFIELLEEIVAFPEEIRERIDLAILH